MTLRIDPSIRHQTLEGFGASGCWTAQLVDGWPASMRRDALEWLFSDRGAALSIWRYNLGAGGGAEIPDASRRAHSLEIGPGRYDLSRDASAIGFLRDAVAMGVSRVIIFSISFPEHMTISGLVSGADNNEPNLRPGAEDDAARYIVDITTTIKRELNLGDVRLSPMNEPQWFWGTTGGRRQEGCHMKPDQLVTLTRACAERLAKADPSILLEGPEGGCWGGETFSYVDGLLKDDTIRKQMGVVAIHSYWSKDEDRKSFLDQYRGAGHTLPLAQTEWCDMQWQRDAGMDGAFTLMRVMHSDLTICNVVSWTFWLAMSNYDFRDGLLYIEKDQTLTPAKRLFVMGHFSRFLKPGAVRIESTISSDALLASVYLSHDGKRIVSVIGNPTEANIALALESVGERGMMYVTDETRDLEVSSFTSREICIPRRSVVTVVIERE